MRKVIALLLTVLMLASALAAIPASAAAKTYDDTTAATENKLLITEIVRSRSAYTRNSEKPILNVMNFVEIYNNSTEAVALDSLSLLLAVEIDMAPTDQANRYLQGVGGDSERPLWREWRGDNKRFISEMEIKTGAIVDKSVATSQTVGVEESFYNKYLKNSTTSVSVEPGKTAVIWLITKTTLDWMKVAEQEISGFQPKTEFLKHYYGNDVNASDYNVVMVWAYSDYTEEDPSVLANDMFNFEYAPTVYQANENYILGVADKTWDVDTDAAYTLVDPEDPDGEKALNDKLYAMCVMGLTIENYSYEKEKSLICAPVNTEPYVQNATEKFAATDPSKVVAHADYFAAGLARSYRENAVISWKCDTPTPGSLPQWHQLMVDSAKRDLIETEVAVINKYIVDTYGYADDGAETGRDEEGIGRDYNFETQEELKNRFNNKGKKDTTTEEGGLSTVVLVIIIVAAVVVVGGAVAVVFLVILPKKKKKAASAAVAEDAPVEEAPVEEAPVEDAPAEENKDE